MKKAFLLLPLRIKMTSLMIFSLVLGLLAACSGQSTAVPIETLAYQANATLTQFYSARATQFQDLPTNQSPDNSLLIPDYLRQTADPQSAATATVVARQTMRAGELPIEAQVGLAGVRFFDENFEQLGGWNVVDDADRWGRYENGQYLLTIKKENQLNWVLNFLQSSNFLYQVTVSAPSCQGDDHFGLMFRVQSTRFYAFGVSCRGEYRLLRYVDGAFKPIIDWTLSPAVEPNGGVNVLAVRAVSGGMTLFVNNMQIASAEDSIISNGGFGLYAATRSSSTLTAAFDNATARVLGDAP
ncbi:MAG TPA: hypothetical protein PK299_02880 [Anaerolineales bacterium]|nr:hypothetical protein [Anaerolineales bacterium]